MSGAGDVNGDGIDDVIVGASVNNATGATGNGTDFSLHSGAAYVVYGTTGGVANVDLSVLTGPTPDNSVGFKILGEAAGDSAGSAVSGAGDVNGDGIDDVIVGAPSHDSGGYQSGAAYVVYGAPGGVPTVALGDLDGPSADNTIGFKITGEALGDYVGMSVSGAGDVNGDGIGDVIVGAIHNEEEDIRAGAAYVIFGASGGLSNIDLDVLAGSAPDNSIGFKIVGEALGDKTGQAVSEAGDVNGDGIDDVIIGAPENNAGGNSAGAAYVLFGAQSDLDNINLAVFSGPNPDNTRGFRITGEAAGDEAGYSVSGSGDVNGDGFDDVIVGARYQDSGGFFSGAAYVVRGLGGSSNVELNAVALNHRGFRVTAEAPNDYAGTSVSGAGDFNGDGFDDMIVGAPRHDAGAGGYSGAAYVVYGACASCGVSLNAVARGTGGLKFAGGAANDSAGVSVSGAGDFNGDGIDDVIVGSPGHNAGAGYSSGAAYVIGGRDPAVFMQPPLQYRPQ